MARRNLGIVDQNSVRWVMHSAFFVSVFFKTTKLPKATAYADVSRAQLLMAAPAADLCKSNSAWKQDL